MLMSSKVLGRIKNNFDYLLWLRKPCVFTLQCSILLMSGFFLKGKRLEQLGDPSFLFPKIYSNLVPQWNISGKIPQFETIYLSKRIVFGEYCLFFACPFLKKSKIKKWKGTGTVCERKILFCNNSFNTSSFPPLPKHLPPKLSRKNYY